MFQYLISNEFHSTQGHSPHFGFTHHEQTNRKSIGYILCVIDTLFFSFPILLQAKKVGLAQHSLPTSYFQASHLILHSLSKPNMFP